MPSSPTLFDFESPALTRLFYDLGRAEMATWGRHGQAYSSYDPAWDALDAVADEVLAHAPVEHAAQLQRIAAAPSWQAHAEEVRVLDDQLRDRIHALVPEEARWSMRSGCPLCGSLGQNPYHAGFTVPLGLSRHLQGIGNTQQCVVVRAADLRGKRQRIRQADQDWVTREAQRQQRRAQEPLYLVEPGREPELIDQGSSSRGVRDAASFAWAHARLRELGFVQRIEQRVESWTRPAGEDHVVYADCREQGLIRFVVAPVRRGRPAGGGGFGLPGTLARFIVRDQWTKNLPRKVEDWIANALGSKAQHVQEVRHGQ